MAKTKSLEERYREAYAIDPNSHETFLLRTLLNSVKNGSLEERDAKLAHTYFMKAEKEDNPNPLAGLKVTTINEEGNHWL